MARDRYERKHRRTHRHPEAVKMMLNMRPDVHMVSLTHALTIPADEERECEDPACICHQRPHD